MPVRVLEVCRVLQYMMRTLQVGSAGTRISNALPLVIVVPSTRFNLAATYHTIHTTNKAALVDQYQQGNK